MPPQPITSTQANQEASCMPPNTYSSQCFGLLSKQQKKVSARYVSTDAISTSTEAIQGCTYIYIYIYVCVYVCMYVCMYVCITV